MAIAACSVSCPSCGRSRRWTKKAPNSIRQHGFRFRADFTFHRRHLAYESNDGGALSGFNIRYSDLPPPTDYRTLLKRDRMTVGFVFLAGLLVGIALLNLDARATYYVRAAEALFLVPYLLALAYAADRISKKGFTSVPTKKGFIRVLHNAQHGRVLELIQEGRNAHLRTFAVIDPAKPPQEELRKMAWLKDQGVISEQEFESFRHKLLDGVSDETDPPLTPKPPGTTLH
jgi:hypothetical protein